jgi:glucose-1-phosphate thymidylyltransferase
MKGILLAGTHATRRLPLLLDDEPLPSSPATPIVLDYSLAVLMQAGVREIAIVATPEQRAVLQAEHGDGAALGLTLSFPEVSAPVEVAGLFETLQPWLGEQPVALVQGDYLLTGNGLADRLRFAAQQNPGATVFAYAVPRSIAGDLRATKGPSVALCGVSFFDARVGPLARSVTSPCPAPTRFATGLLELHRRYLRAGSLQVLPLDAGVLCQDWTAPEALLAGSLFVQTWEQSTGRRLGCLEEIALQEGLIDPVGLERLVASERCPEKQHYLHRVLREATAPRRRAA